MSIELLLKDKKKLKKITTAAFRTVDLDHSGFIEGNQIQHILVSCAQDLGVEVPSKEEINLLIAQLDVGGKGGRLSLEEFQVLIQEVLTMIAQEEAQAAT